MLSIFAERGVDARTADATFWAAKLAVERERFVEATLDASFRQLIAFVRATEREAERGGATDLDEGVVGALAATFAATWRDALVRVNADVLRLFANFVGRPGGIGLLLQEDRSSPSRGLVVSFQRTTPTLQKSSIDFGRAPQVNGVEVLKQVLTQLLLYYTRFQEIVRKAWKKPPAFAKDLVPTATILEEIKKYSRIF